MAGKFTRVHDAWWAPARSAHGDAAGTRALIEVLLLHRHMAHEHVMAGLATLPIDRMGGRIVSNDGLAMRLTVQRRAPLGREERSPGHGPAGSSLWGVVLGEERRGPPRHLVLLLQDKVAAIALPQLLRLRRGHPGTDTALHIVLLQPAMQTGLGDPESFGSSR